MFYSYRVRFVSLSVAAAAAAAAVAFTAAPRAARAAEPLITAFIGTQTSTTHLGYFVLDFNETVPPAGKPLAYAFGWYYEGTKTDADFILALQASLTGPNGFKQTGAENNFVTLLGYDNQVKFNDFAGKNSGDPNGYWNLWLGTNGTDWSAAQFGAADVILSDTPQYTFSTFTNQNELSGAPWHGWRWLSDYTTQSALPPRTPFVAASAAPEPGALALLTVGIAGLAARRRRSSSGGER